MSVDDLIQAMREIRMNQTMNQIPVGHTIHSPRGDQNPQLIEAALCLQAGLQHPETHYSEQVLDAADKMRTSVSLQQLIMGEACATAIAPPRRSTSRKATCEPFWQRRSRRFKRPAGPRSHCRQLWATSPTSSCEMAGTR